MSYDPQKHHRRSIRLQGYDYSQEGAYFITICTRQRECLFGAITNGVMVLDASGQIVIEEWTRLPKSYPHLEVDTFVVMPNHLHGVLILRHINDQQKPIGEIIRHFKRYSTLLINQQRGSTGVAVWQRNYYERIIRNEAMLNAIQEYIAQNPANWQTDAENPNYAR